MFSTSQSEEQTDRAQVGIGTLIVFIAMVLVAAIAAGVLINTAGFLQNKAESTGQASTSEVSDGINVVSAVGIEDGSGNIDTIEIIVKKRAGSGNIDISNTIIQYLAGGEKNELIYDSSGATSGSAYGTTGIDGVEKDVLDDETDRVKVTLDLASSPLSSGSSATLTFISPAGSQTEAELQIPSILNGNDGEVHVLK